MSTDYSANLGIGYVIDREDLIAPFRVLLEEKSHMEDRFDKYTGAKLSQQAKVIDREAGEAYVLEGVTYEEGYELYEVLAEKFGCNIQDRGGYSDGETLYVTVNAKHTGEDDHDCGRVVVGSSILFDEVVKAKGKLKKLAKMFKSSYGIDLGEAKVFVAWDIS